jgi:hypothetical protein
VRSCRTNREFAVLQEAPHLEFIVIPLKPVIIKKKLSEGLAIATLTAIVTEMVLHSPGKHVDWPMLRYAKNGTLEDLGTRTCVLKMKFETEQQHARRGPKPVELIESVGLDLSADDDMAGIVTCNPNASLCLARTTGPSTLLDMRSTIVPLSAIHESITRSENNEGIWRTTGACKYWVREYFRPEIVMFDPENKSRLGMKEKMRVLVCPSADPLQIWYCASYWSEESSVTWKLSKLGAVWDISTGRLACFTVDHGE